MVVGQLELQMYASMARLQSDMDNAKRTVGGAVNKINNILGAIGAGISVDFMLGLAQKSNEYNKSLAALSTQISGATNQIKELDAASRKLSVQFGTDALKQSTAFYEILSAGITDTTQATALLTEANRLAIGGNADLMISVDGLTSIIKGYGNAAGTASEIADTLFTASLAGKLSIQELSENIGKVIPLATTMGISLEEVTSGISALTLGGISAKESITGVRAILATVAKPSAEAARLAKEIGLEFNTAGMQAMGFAGFLEEVKTKTQGSADKMAVLFGGVESLVPALALTGNAGIEFNNIIGQMANKAGAAENAFNKMAASPGFQWDKFMSTMSNIAITLGDALANVLTPAAEMAAKALNKLFGFNNVTGIEKQVQLINELTDKVESMSNRRNIPLVGGLLFDKKEFDLLEHQLEMAKVDLADMQKAQQAATSVQKQATVEIAHNAVELAKNNETKEKSVQISTRLGNAFNSELYLLRQYESEAKRARDITASVATEQEQYNQKLEELDRLKPYLSVETYNRALQKAQEELNKTSTVTRSTTDEVSQLWIQAGRNIQSSLANSIFDFFNGGLSNMVQNVKNTLLRIASEFAALKLSQSIGLAGMFGGIAGSTSGATSALSGSGGLSGALNMASIGSNLLSAGSSAFNTGFGATGLISRVGSMLPGSVGSFFGGMGVSGTQAAAQAGASALWGASGASTAASMGSSFAAAAGPAIALIAVDQIGRLLAGDKKLGGAEMIPVIGGFMAALFGRGPLKQKETNLIGDFTSEGFAGITSTKFKADGGLARSSKVDRVMIDTDTGNLLNQYRGLVEGGISKVLDPFAREAAVAAVQLGKYLDDVTTSTAESMQKVGESLGKGKDAMEGFYYTVNIASEKGKSLTDEQISGVLTDMADTMARHVIPNIDAFRKAGESAADAALRIGNEFEALVSASTVLGVSLGTARTVLQQSSIEGRSAFIEAAGGIDALNSKAQYFAANFLDGSEIIKRNSELLTEQMGELGLSTDMTKEDFKNLVQSFGQVNGVSEEMLIALLNIAPLFNEVKTAADAAGTSVAVLAEKLRLTNDEMIAVGTVLGNVGYSFDEIMQVLRDLPAEEITAFVQKMGGIEGLLNSSASFADNFLTAGERLQVKTDYLAKRLTDLGVSSDLTAEQFRDLVMGQGEFANASAETRAGALLLAGDFFELNGGIITLSDSVGGLNNVAAAASVSVDSLVQAGVDFGLTMQQISALLNSTSPADLANWASNNQQINQQGDFFKQNFLTPEQQFANDSQDLANRLAQAGIDPNISRSGFAAIVQDFSAQNNAAARNLMQLFDSVHDRIEASAEAANNFVAPLAEIINQDAIDAAQNRLRDTENALSQAQNQVNQARQNEVNLLQQTADKYRNYEQAMKNASNALALSAASPLTPMQKYQEAHSQLQAAARSGDYEKLQQAGSAFLEASKLVNASGSQYTADYSFVKGLYDQAASAAGQQASDAERQLGALGTINDSVLTVAQAVNNLAAAQSAYDAAKSAVPDPIYNTPPDAQLPQVLSMPPSNFDMSNVIQFPSDTQIRDFVNANYGDWKLIYDKAKEYGVSSERLSNATGIALSDIKDWVTANNLPMFERGTDFVQKGGLAVLHRAEAVTPARSMDTMAVEIRSLRQENSDIKRELQESNRQLSALIRVVAESGKRTAEHIVKGGEKQAFYREVKRA